MRSSEPYSGRPAWYGFLIAGSVAGLVWAAAAGAQAADGLIAGSTWSLLHYGYVRWAMRGAAGIAAGPAATADEAPGRQHAEVHDIPRRDIGRVVDMIRREIRRPHRGLHDAGQTGPARTVTREHAS